LEKFKSFQTMFKNIIASVLVIMMHLTVFSASAETKYAVSDIPDSMKANAKIVIRNWEQLFEIKSLGKGVETINYAITILNENGLYYAMLVCPYSQKLQRIHSIKGTIYDASGKKIETLQQDKIIDHSAISGYSLYEDHRVKFFEPRTRSYPFTVEYSFITECDGMLHFPHWIPVKDYNVSVESSKFQITCPPEMSFRYKEKNLKNKVNAVKGESTTSYNWEISQVKALIEQPFSASFTDFCPVVYTAPDNFEIEGYKGNLTTWESFGHWINQLNQGRDVLSDETRTLLVEKVKHCSTDYEKARTIYEYMQSKTRYLNVTVGIGGWQPIPAETVDRLGYGDCKALTNYMKSMLAVVGLKSYFAYNFAGANVEQTDALFPSNHFNHVILCVPLNKDTIWLECTSQHLPFGFIGNFTDDRYALVVTEDGGKLCKTRQYTPAENVLTRTTQLQLQDDGKALIKTSSTHLGLMYNDRLSFFLAGDEDRKRLILDDIDVPGAMLVQLNYHEKRGEVPALTENLDIEVPKYATISGIRIIASIIPVDRLREVPKKVSNRISDVIIRRPSTTVDTVVLIIPAGYQAESVPAEVKVTSRFGNYSLQTVISGDKIICVRNQEMKRGRYPASAYDELVDFFKRIVLADNSKVSLKKI
jgi:hypothetical protein